MSDHIREATKAIRNMHVCLQEGRQTCWILSLGPLSLIIETQFSERSVLQLCNTKWCDEMDLGDIAKIFVLGVTHMDFDALEPTMVRRGLTKSSMETPGRVFSTEATHVDVNRMSGGTFWDETLWAQFPDEIVLESFAFQTNGEVRSKQRSFGMECARCLNSDASEKTRFAHAIATCFIFSTSCNIQSRWNAEETFLKLVT